jgi:predicted exporter
VLVFRLQLSFDLGLFFPRGSDTAQQVLLQQLSRGPGSRLILIGLRGNDRAGLAEASIRMKAELERQPLFLQVQNGELPEKPLASSSTVSRYRFLLSDPDFSAKGLRNTLEDRLQDLAFGSGRELVELIATDPYLSMLEILEKLAPGQLSGEAWFTSDGQAVLVAETAAPAIDIRAQEKALAAIRSAFDGLTREQVTGLEMTGVGAFGVELQQTIRSEAQWRSSLAIGALMVVLLIAYRRPLFLLLAGLPLGLGFLTGLAAVALVFDEVHGITLAFGFTLLGIAIDFPLHLFSHARGLEAGTAMKLIWPTMRIGAASTLLAYAAITMAGSNGLAQLGLFTSGGLVAAVTATRFWLPHLLQNRASLDAVETDSPVSPRLSFIYASLLLVAAVVIIQQTTAGNFWEDSLDSLSPLPRERLADDNRLRNATGGADMRYQVVLQDANLENLLARSERLNERLRQASDDGLLENWQSVSQLLPSHATQEARKRRIPDQDSLATALNAAAQGLPFRTDAFNPFLKLAQTSRDLPLLTPDSYSGTPFDSWLDAHLLQLESGWAALTFLVNPDTEALPQQLAASVPGVQWTDLRESSTGLLREFRNGAVRAMSAGAILMLALLLFSRFRVRRVLWLLLSVGAALALTLALVALLHGRLTVIHLIALLLVFGLGLDYALFFSRDESGRERKNSLHAVSACAASTTLAFGILGGSSVPMLKFLGTTVAAGSAASFILAFAGSRFLSRP